ncbi:hypothetical protein O3M35_003615 [Rhynocoris fuscipes]|uniref:Uncharacterized protein n=1 Tax=Rhynocoris fuscipes TaxID=488301 RepID=A0AAW1CRC6_9HEMI
MACRNGRCAYCTYRSCNGKPSFTTRDHIPILPSEKERIQNAGGIIMIERVNGSLAVSRALGDYEYKNVEGRGPCEQLVSPEPEIFVRDRSDENDEFLVLACDGIWDVMSNEEVCDFIRYLLLLTDDLEGSRDNMSIILVTFPCAPKPNEHAKLQENELNQSLVNLVQELITNVANIDFATLLKYLDECTIPNLPPGGGLFAKRNLIKDVFKNMKPEAEIDDENLNQI